MREIDLNICTNGNTGLLTIDQTLMFSSYTFMVSFMSTTKVTFKVAIQMISNYVFSQNVSWKERKDDGSQSNNYFKLDFPFMTFVIYHNIGLMETVLTSRHGKCFPSTLNKTLHWRSSEKHKLWAFGMSLKKYNFYRTQVWSYSAHVTHSLTDPQTCWNLMSRPCWKLIESTLVD